MTKNLYILLLSLSCVLLSSCGSMRVYVNPEGEYSRKNPITINKAFDDQSGTLGELQFLLQSNGYRLMSYGAAEKALNLQSKTQNGTIEQQITNTISFNSVYVLDLNYNYYFDVFLYNYRSFSATITDLKTGEIIMTANFRGDKGVRSVLKELVNKMNAVIK